MNQPREPVARLNEEVLKGLWNPAAPWYMPHQRSVVILSWLAGLVLAFWLALQDYRSE